MTELKVASEQSPTLCPSLSDAEKGEQMALAGLLENAKVRHGFQYEAMQSTIPQLATEAKSLPFSEVTWGHLSAVEMEHGEVAAAAEWQTLKQAAREELASGHRAASLIEGEGATALQRARFLVLRESFIEDWQPKGGLEYQLIDTLTQAATAQSYWMEKLTTRTTQEAAEDLRDRNELSRQDQLFRYGAWLPERISTSEALQECVAMVDKFNRLYLRTLRTLRDLRRYSIVVQNAGQVNVGQQQVNVRAEKADQKAVPVKRRRKD